MHAEVNTDNSTHAVVNFEADDTLSVVPLKRICGDIEEVTVGSIHDVHWSKNKKFRGTIVAIGDETTMINKIRELSSDDEEDFTQETPSPDANEDKAGTQMEQNVQKQISSENHKKVKNKSDTFVIKCVGSPPRSTGPPSTPGIKNINGDSHVQPKLDSTLAACARRL